MKTAIVGLSPFAYESVTVGSSAVGLTAAIYSQAGYAVQAFLTLEVAEIRWRIDGSNPTSTEGHVLALGQNLTLDSPDAVKNFRAIRTGTTSGTLRVTYLRG